MTINLIHLILYRVLNYHHMQSLFKLSTRASTDTLPQLSPSNLPVCHLSLMSSCLVYALLSFLPPPTAISPIPSCTVPPLSCLQTLSSHLPPPTYTANPSNPHFGRWRLQPLPTSYTIQSQSLQISLLLFSLMMIFLEILMIFMIFIKCVHFMVISSCIE